MKIPKLTLTLLLLNLIIGAGSLFAGVFDMSLQSLADLDRDSLNILIISRLPRLLAIYCTGMSLATAGLIMQTLCANKFVSPTTGSTLQSAQFGIVLALLFLPDSTLWQRALFSFAAAIGGTLLFVYLVLKVQFREVVLVPLVGIMLGSIIMGITNFLAFKFNVTQALASWSVGHFSAVIKGRYELVYLCVPLIALTFIYAHYFNIASLGPNMAQNLGLSYRTVMILGLCLAAMLTASVVVVVGAISYIGLIVPNLVSMFKGDNLRNIVIDCALAGALLVLVCDLIGRLVIYPYELPIELIIGGVGSIIFIGLIFYRIDKRTFSLSFLRGLRSKKA